MPHYRFHPVHTETHLGSLEYDGNDLQFLVLLFFIEDTANYFEIIFSMHGLCSIPLMFLIVSVSKEINDRMVEIAKERQIMSEKINNEK